MQQRRLVRHGYLRVDANQGIGTGVELFFQRNDDALEFRRRLLTNEVGDFADVGVVECGIHLVQ